MISNSGEKIPIASLAQMTPPKKMPFLGISPLKERNYDSPVEKCFKVSVEGNIGAGKSTFINYFKTASSVETYAVGKKIILQFVILDQRQIR